jgi:hypothetical protein
MRIPQIRNISTKFVVLGVGAIAVLTVTLMAVAAWQSSVFNAKARVRLRSW